MARKSNGATISDVAREAGVAPMTVSRFLNDHPNIRRKTMKRIKAAIEKLNYTPNYAARMLTGQNSHAIGVILPTLIDPFFGALAEGVEQIARTHGYLVWVSSSGMDPNVEQELVRQMNHHMVEGIVLAAAPGEAIHRYGQHSTRIVAVDTPPENVQLDFVGVDNVDGASLAVEHLIQHGRRDIFAIGEKLKQYTLNQRLQGYQNAMRRHGLEPADPLACDDFEQTKALFRELLSRKERSLAFFSLNNLATIKAFEALNEIGATIPEDIALVGFDDFELAPFLRPQITVVRQPSQELGRQAARLLFELLIAPDDRPSLHIAMPVELIVRESCGCTGSRLTHMNSSSPSQRNGVRSAF
jgi:LacI family transcriptional regulator